ncbi:hypothetical protein [Mesobacillus subterraneus]|nr:hypothetical protein [Mesobacillus subterraneus]
MNQTLWWDSWYLRGNQPSSGYPLVNWCLPPYPLAAKSLKPEIYYSLK